MTPMNANVTRQPAIWPSSVPSGTPATLAMVRPRKTFETARARCERSTIEAPATDAAPKNAPWGSPVRNRMASSESIPGANAEARLPTANVPISAMSTVRRGNDTLAPASSGAPTTTPSA